MEYFGDQRSIPWLRFSGDACLSGRQAPFNSRIYIEQCQQQFFLSSTNVFSVIQDNGILNSGHTICSMTCPAYIFLP